MNKISRRNFIKKIIYTTVGVSTAVIFGDEVIDLIMKKSSIEKVNGDTLSNSKVIIIKNNKLINDKNQIQENIIKEMLSEGIKKLFNSNSIEESLIKLFSPKDIIGIKVNCLAGKQASTHPEIVYSIVQLLKDIGVPSYNIIIWDRLNRELENCGFKLNSSKNDVRCFGTDEIGYEFEPTEIGSIGSCFSNILNEVSALINVPVLKQHGLTGVSIAMKNYYGAIHNPNKYHDNCGDPYIADLWLHPSLKNKTKLIVCDAINPVYHGGPAYSKYNVKYNSIIISRDAVALDYIGMGIINKFRQEANMPTLAKAGIAPKYIETAGNDNYKIGNCKPEKIIVEEYD
jgi:uncharacterized protein (DUF362 family)